MLVVVVVVVVVVVAVVVFILRDARGLYGKWDADVGVLFDKRRALFLTGDVTHTPDRVAGVSVWFFFCFFFLVFFFLPPSPQGKKTRKRTQK